MTLATISDVIVSTPSSSEFNCEVILSNNKTVNVNLFHTEGTVSPEETVVELSGPMSYEDFRTAMFAVTEAWNTREV